MGSKGTTVIAVEDKLAELRNITVFAQESAEYQESLGSYFTLQAGSVKPKCFIRPTTPAALGEAVALLAEHDVKFAVRSGGHFCTAGVASQEDGVTIDLRAFNEVEVKESGTRVRLGTGSTWGYVYRELDAQGIFVPGGRETNVGVGGLILGGGLAYRSDSVGLSCDNVEDIELVLASGELIHVNESERPDLFRALKGGSNNFGVATHFTLKCYPSRKMWAGEAVHPLDTKEVQLDAFNAYAGDRNFGRGASVVQTFLKSKSMGDIFVDALMHTDATEEPTCFKAFQDIQPQYAYRFRELGMTEFAIERDAYTPKGFGNIFIGCNSRLDRPLLSRVYELWENSAASVDSIPGIRWAMTLQSVSPDTFEASSFLRDVVSPFEPAATPDGEKTYGPMIVYLLAGTWDRLEDSKAAEKAARQLITDIEREIVERDLGVGYRYLNYSDPSQDVYSDGTKDGGPRKQWLREISKKYDPTGIFQRNVPGGFKLF